MTHKNMQEAFGIVPKGDKMLQQAFSTIPKACRTRAGDLRYYTERPLQLAGGFRYYTEGALQSCGWVSVRYRRSPANRDRFLWLPRELSANLMTVMAMFAILGGFVVVTTVVAVAADS